jgi:REP element-mobilizing transposase RayT
MARRHRIRFCGAIYHVMARGNRKERIFVDDVDRRRFLKIVAVGLNRFSAECFVQCLMNNHFHLVVHTPWANISNVMHHIDGLYTQYENWRHHTTGHVLEGRYVALVIDDTVYLKNAIGYVLRNPVEAGLVSDPGKWRWSSYNAAMGRAQPVFETLSWLAELFPAKSLDDSRRQLAEYVRKEPDNYPDVVRAAAEGPYAFKQHIRRVIGTTLYRAELPRSYRAMAHPPLSEIFARVKRAERRQTILRAHIVHRISAERDCRSSGTSPHDRQPHRQPGRQLSADSRLSSSTSRRRQCRGLAPT